MKIHAYILLFLFCCFQNVAQSQGSWNKLDVPTDHFLRAVHFTDSLYGWAAGNGGVIIHTEDGGNTWEVQESQTEYDIADIVFLNRNFGWATAQNYIHSPFGTVLLKTNNGGETWIHETYPQNDIFINCILFIDSLKVWMGGSPHALVKSEDGGQNWQQATIDTSILAFFPVLSIKFYDGNYGYACGGMFEIAGVIWRTSDGGETWYAIDPVFAPADEVHELHTYDSLRVLGSGGDPDFGYGVAFIRTWDGGLTWEYEEIGLPGNSYDLDFRNDTEAWAPLGYRQQMIYSIDGGETWEAYATPSGTAIYDIIFPDTLHGYAVGDSGAFLKYKPPLGVAIPEYSATKGNPLSLHCFPNPFSSHATIRFQIPDPGSRNNAHPTPNPLINPRNSKFANVSLKVFNSLGAEISTIMAESLPAGSHEINLERGGLLPGIYFIRLVVTGENDKTYTESLKFLVEN